MSIDSLDVFIGLITTYLILSLIVTAIGEAISNLANFKGQTLFLSVCRLTSKKVATNLFQHVNIKRLRSNTWFGEEPFRYPSYLPSNIFADTLIDYLVNDLTGEAALTPNTINNALENGDENHIKQLRRMWQEAACDIEAFKLKIEHWYEETGARSAGWFKRKMSIALFAIGLVLAVSLNADTIHMFKLLSQNADLRQALVDKAIEFGDGARTMQEDAPAGEKSSLVTETEVGAICAAMGTPADKCSNSLAAKASLPLLMPMLGWEQLDYVPKSEKTGDCWYLMPFWLLKFLGFFLTAAALSLGAPFWFDILQKLIRIRTSIKPEAGKQADKRTTDGTGVSSTPVAKSLITAIDVEDDATKSLQNFNADQYGYDPVNIFWSARLASLAYSDVTEVEASLEQFECSGTLIENEASETQCLVAYTTEAAFISFRGTEQNLQDWLTDLQVKLQKPSWDEGAAYQVHSGFDSALHSIWPQIIQYLQEQGVFERGMPIWFSGHSLGGALTVLAAIRMHDDSAFQNSESIIAAIHTFGQPRVGDSKCAELADRLFVNRYFRSVNQRDVVARVPLPRTPDIVEKARELDSPIKVYDYKHAGRVIYFNDIGQAMMDPPMWYRKLDTLAVSVDKDKLKDAISQAVSDHSIGGYLVLQKNVLI